MHNTSDICTQANLFNEYTIKRNELSSLVFHAAVMYSNANLYESYKTNNLKLIAIIRKFYKSNLF